MNQPSPLGPSGASQQQSPYAGNGGRPPRYDVQPWRKVAYYGGALLQVVGFCLFFYVFSQSFTGSSDPSVRAPHMFRVFPLAAVGMLAIFLGSRVRRVGRRGLSGSGVLLSPEGEARDSEPWNRSAGAQDQQRLEEVPALRGLAGGGTSAPEIRVRCRSCGFLDSEDATYCSGCGAQV